MDGEGSASGNIRGKFQDEVRMPRLVSLVARGLRVLTLFSVWMWRQFCLMMFMRFKLEVFGV